MAGSLFHPSPIFLLNLLSHMTQIVSPEQGGCREESHTRCGNQGEQRVLKSFMSNKFCFELGRILSPQEPDGLKISMIMYLKPDYPI